MAAVNASAAPVTPERLAAGAALREEFAYLRRPLLIFLAALILGGIAVGVSSWLLGQREQALDDTRRRHDTALARLQSAEKELDEIRRFQPRYLQLQAAGIVGTENRLAWVESINLSQQRHKLLSVEYEIEPQQLVNLSAPIALGDYQLRASRMMLRTGLMHDLDLFNLLDDLAHAGLYTVQDCRMKRLEAAAEAGLSPRIKADCTLVWVTLGSPPAPPVAPPATPEGP